MTAELKAFPLKAFADWFLKIFKRFSKST
jgi:hypothetical protein